MSGGIEEKRPFSFKEARQRCIYYAQNGGDCTGFTKDKNSYGMYTLRNGKEFIADADAVESYMNVGEAGCEFRKYDDM